MVLRVSVCEIGKCFCVCIKLATTCERGIEGHKEKEKGGGGGWV